MAACEFYVMSEEDQAALRDNPRRCVACCVPASHWQTVWPRPVAFVH